MESSLVFWSWVSLVLLSYHFYLSLGCEEKERRGLLEVKTFINVPNGSFPLSSWDEGREDCCNWEGVVCNPINGRVVELNLDFPMYDELREASWYVNASVFATFEELRRLDLSGNNIIGCQLNEGFERLSGLKKLEFLDLSGNQFNTSILPSLATLSSLETLIVAGNHLDSRTSIHDLESLSRLKKLEILDLGGNLLNASVLPSLATISSLRILKLAEFRLEAFTSIHELASLKRLEVLDLSWTGLAGTIPPSSLGTLSSLKALSLSGNGLNGSLPVQELASLKRLEVLDLSDNRLAGAIPPSLGSLSSLKALSLKGNQLNSSLPLQELASLKRLEVLDLRYNMLAGAIPPSLGSLSSLKALSLKGNQLNGSLPEGLCRLQKLQELDLSGNELDGGIPPCLGNLASLQILDLSRNKFTGSFPSSIITNHTSLVFFDISHNRFEGAFSLYWFANHTKLKLIDLTCDDSKLEIETKHSTWVPSFQLEVVYLSNCNINRRYQGGIPNFLSTQYALKAVDLSHNGISGSFPTWLLRNNTGLEYLNLMNNSMASLFDLPSHLNTSIQFLDISNNHIYGHLRTNIGMLLPKLWILNMSRNSLQGGISSSLGDLGTVSTLDLSNNNLTGEIPANLTAIPYLLLGNNQFTKIASNGLSNRLYLNRLDISYNQLSGNLPSWMGEISDLRVLTLRGNHFQGPIPISFCQLNRIEILDISHNNLSGSMPSCFNLSYLTYLHLQGNELTGSLSSSLLRSPNLVTLDIRYNNLKGILPSWIGAFPKLRALLLRGNHFHGSIPIDYCHLKLLRILDLSYNNLSGAIPSCFNKISFGTTMPDTAFSSKVEEFGFAGSNVVGHTEKYIESYPDYRVIDEKQEVEFMDKGRSETYMGDVLNFMSGMDLSCNKLTGEIPPEIGNLSNLHALNVSHNRLTGQIPKSLSNLMALESLDLSHNQLSGSIPPQLIELTSLEVFTVAQNNLSGRIPDFTAQFGTFTESTYEGNSGLCGPPLKKSCAPTPAQSMPIPMEEGNGSDDLIIKSVSFIVSYIACFLGFIIPLYLDKNWREMYFHAMDRYLLVPATNCFLSVYVWIFITVKHTWK